LGWVQPSPHILWYYVLYIIIFNIKKIKNSEKFFKKFMIFMHIFFLSIFLNID
jgi:hypothetical protein